MKKERLQELIVKAIILSEGVKNRRATGVFSLPKYTSEQLQFLKGIADEIIDLWDEVCIELLNCSNEDDSSLTE